MKVKIYEKNRIREFKLKKIKITGGINGQTVFVHINEPYDSALSGCFLAEKVEVRE